MRTKDKHEVLLASRNLTLHRAFRRESAAHNFVLDTIDSPKRMELLSNKRILPDIAILDLDSFDKSIYSLIYYLRRLKYELPVLVMALKADISLIDEVNKNLSVLLSMPKPTDQQSMKELFQYVYDFFSEDLKKRIENVEYLKEEDVFACGFANKEILFIKRGSISDDHKQAVVKNCVTSEDGYYFCVNYEKGQSDYVPWDFVRYLADRESNVPGDEEKDHNLTAEEIGFRICSLRGEKDMTQDELARKTGILRNNISRLENGYHYPSLPVLEKIAEALGVPVVRLLVR